MTARAPQPNDFADSSGSHEGSSSIFRCEGEYWTVTYTGTTFRLRASKGLRYIAYLLANPRHGVHVRDLAALDNPSGDGRHAEVDGAVEGNSGVILDARATAEYRRRLGELREDLEATMAAVDLGQASGMQHEIEVITHELSAAYGIGGRARTHGDPTERLRKAVTNQIRRALERISTEHPALERHIGNALRTGFVCAYNPEQPVR